MSTGWKFLQKCLPILATTNSPNNELTFPSRTRKEAAANSFHTNLANINSSSTDGFNAVAIVCNPDCCARGRQVCIESIVEALLIVLSYPDCNEGLKCTMPL